MHQSDHLGFPGAVSRYSGVLHTATAALKAYRYGRRVYDMNEVKACNGS